MYTKYSIKKLVILEIISLLVVGLINPSVTSILEIDVADGVWTKKNCYSIFASADSTPAVFDDIVFY